MLSLSCPSCHKLLNVKDELAGKKVGCPHCKQTIDVADRTLVGEPGNLPGPTFAVEATFPPGPSTQTETILAPQTERKGNGGHDKSRESLEAAAHYEVEGEIARGGMGAIMRAVDQDIHREVAVKFLLNHADAKQKARFVEEAQITGQLEHPNIVPIYQLGAHPDGRSFFSMKIVKGRSLAEILKDERRDDTLGRLLNIFVSICNAMAYAHSRHVIHRDLKPANVMVGDFGEVYVMDWGLAKVLGKEADGRGQEAGDREKVTHIQRKRSLDDNTQPGNSSAASLGEKVTVNRQTLGELTQAGAIMGTPAYMPPEQAQGEEVDQRADIYSMGAILYEIMTRTPPVGRGSDMMAILMRVVDGQIDEPVKRSPERARAGWIPSELSAIAMKALAKEPKNRYQTVEALRRDLELFLEGRSVSAKHDTFREMAWKLVKRNKGVSITAAVALVVLAVVAGFFLKSNYDARVVAEKAQIKAEENHQAYLDQVKGSVPVLLRAARAALDERKFDDALVQVSLAAKSAPDNADARLLKGQLLITRQRFTEAIPELEEVLKLKGKDTEVRKLTELCRNAQPEDAAALLAFAEVFTQRQEHALADGMLSGEGQNAVAARQRLLEVYRKRIEAAWPGQGNSLTMSAKGKYSLSLSNVTDLSPLRGIPLSELDLQNNDQIRELAPLKGMPLNALNLNNCNQVSDLSPLKGMPLTKLYIYSCPLVSDLSPLQGMPLTTLNLQQSPLVRDLEPLKGMPLSWLNLYDCAEVRDLEPVKGMPLTWLDLRGIKAVRDLQFLKGKELTLLNLDDCTQVQNLSPLQGMPLTSLSLARCTQVQNLSPLQGMPLTSLNLGNCTQFQNLESLKGLPLTWLDLSGCEVRDLEPLRGMKLTELRLNLCKKVKNLEPLQGMALTRLILGSMAEVRDLEPLRGMKLTVLNLVGCTQIQNLEPLKGMPLKYLNIIQTGVTDLSSLQGMELREIYLTPRNITQSLDLLRDMKSLHTIGIHDAAVWPPAEFWKKYDAGEFKK